MILIIAEKPSLARNIIAGIGGKMTKMSGYYEGEGFLVTWAFGHLFSLCDIEDYEENPPETVRWTMDNLPCFPEKFKFRIKKDAAKQTDAGAARQFELIKKLCGRPDVDTIVNAGDGANQHPSQTMLDLYSIYKTQGTLENLNIFLVGDLKYGRTVHSLLMAMRHFNPIFHFIAPDELKMPEEYKLYCKTHQIKYVEHTDFSEEIIADADILYMTRVQRERFTDLMEYERVKNVYILRNKMLENTRPNLRILHPLPRVNEIAYDVDDNPKAYYFQQAQNGLYAREAILCDVLGITLEDVKNDILL